MNAMQLAQRIRGRASELGVFRGRADQLAQRVEQFSLGTPVADPPEVYENLLRVGEGPLSDAEIARIRLNSDGELILLLE